MGATLEVVTRPVAFNYLDICAIGYGLDKTRLDDAARALRSVGGYVI